jgi:hypothetical protein
MGTKRNHKLHVCNPSPKRIRRARKEREKFSQVYGSLFRIPGIDYQFLPVNLCQPALKNTFPVNLYYSTKTDEKNFRQSTLFKIPGTSTGKGILPCSAN